MIRTPRRSLVVVLLVICVRLSSAQLFGAITTCLDTAVQNCVGCDTGMQLLKACVQYSSPCSAYRQFFATSYLQNSSYTPQTVLFQEKLAFHACIVRCIDQQSSDNLKLLYANSQYCFQGESGSRRIRFQIAVLLLVALLSIL